MTLMAIEKAQPQQLPSKRKEITRGKRSYVPVPITNAMRPIALALIARGGMPYEEMSDILDTEYKVVIAPEELQRLATTDANVISELRKRIRKSAEADAQKMLKKVDKILNRSLDRTIGDMEKMDELDALYHNGAIDDDAYRQGTAKLKIMPLNEVLKIAEHLNPPVAKGMVPQQPVYPSNSDSSNPQNMSELSSELAEALKAGNTIELQRIMFQKAKPENDSQA